MVPRDLVRIYAKGTNTAGVRTARTANVVNKSCDRPVDGNLRMVTYSVGRSPDADQLASEKAPGGEHNHVVVRNPSILHVFKRTTDMGVAVVAEQVMHPALVSCICLLHSSVPFLDAVATLGFCYLPRLRTPRADRDEHSRCMSYLYSPTI